MEPYNVTISTEDADAGERFVTIDAGSSLGSVRLVLHEVNGIDCAEIFHVTGGNAVFIATMQIAFVPGTRH